MSEEDCKHEGACSICGRNGRFEFYGEDFIIKPRDRAWIFRHEDELHE